MSISKRSPDERQRNPGPASPHIASHSAALHAGYLLPKTVAGAISTMLPISAADDSILTMHFASHAGAEARL
jgi:hypothetical protein